MEGIVVIYRLPFGVGHRETSCILLPAVCKFNASKNVNVSRQQRVHHLLTKDTIVMGVLQARGVDAANSDLSDVLDAVIRELGLPRTLKDVGVGR
jgi:alcohol dehydrogenase class IV